MGAAGFGPGKPRGSAGASCRPSDGSGGAPRKAARRSGRARAEPHAAPTEPMEASQILDDQQIQRGSRGLSGLKLRVVAEAFPLPGCGI